MKKLLNQINARRPLTKRKIAVLASLLIAAMGVPFLGLQTVSASSDHQELSDHENDSDGLVGTWLVQVTLDPASLPPGGLLNFTRLETYAPGGVLLESNTGPGAGGPPGQGNWTTTKHHQFASTELRLGFDAANAFTGTSKIRSSLTLQKGGNEFTAIVQTDIILPNGVMLPFHPTGTSHGTRVPIEGVN